MEYTTPVSIRDTADGVSEDSQCEDCGACSGGEGGNMVCPRKAVIEEDAKVAYGM